MHCTGAPTPSTSSGKASKTSPIGVQAVFLVRPGELSVPAALGRRGGRLSPDRPDPTTILATIDRYRPTLSFRADVLRPGDPRVGGARGEARPQLAAPLRVGGGVAPAPIYRALARADGRRDPRRHRLHRGRLHLHLQFSRVQPTGQQRPAHARLPGAPGGRGGNAGADGRRRRPVDPRPQYRGPLLEPAPADEGDFVGEWIKTGDKYSARRRGLLPLRGPQRRHAQGRGDLGVADRGRDGTAGARRGSRVRRRGGAGRGGAGQAEGVRGAAEPARECRPDACAPGVGEGRLAPYKYPRTIEFVAELPKTATGKIQRYRLRGWAHGSAGPPAGPGAEPGRGSLPGPSPSAREREEGRAGLR